MIKELNKKFYEGKENIFGIIDNENKVSAVKSVIINYRTTPAFKKLVIENAKIHQVSVSQYIRALIILDTEYIIKQLEEKKKKEEKPVSL